MTIYSILVFIHIFSAIFGVGSLFILTIIIRSAKTMEQLRYSYQLFNKIHIHSVIYTLLLIFSGLGMCFLQPQLFHQLWVQVSLVLIVLFFIIGPLWLRPIMKPILELVRNFNGDSIPKEYHQLYKRMKPVDFSIQVIFILIILLMAFKP